MIKSALQSSLTNDVKYRSMSVGNLPSSEYLIETVVVGAAGAASVTFENLSQYSGVYRHLQLVVVARGTLDSQIMSMRINGDSGNNYANHGLTGEVEGGTRAVRSFGSSSQNSIFRVAAQAHSSSASGAFSAGIIEILDPFSTLKNKTIRSMSGQVRQTDESIALFSGLYLSTSAISSITLFRAGSNFVEHSRFSLYGVV